jgi:hypothetical protein
VFETSIIFGFILRHALLFAQASSPTGSNWILICLRYGLKLMDIFEKKFDRNYVDRYHTNDLSLNATVVAPLLFSLSA